MYNGRKIRIAIIDDDEDDFFIISDYIKQIEGADFEIDWCGDFATAIEKIKSQNYQLYFVDYRLGNHTGLELLQQAAYFGCDEPIILLTGKGSKSIDIKAMESGATDYLVKSELTVEKLERCIRYSLDRAESMKELKARENKYRNLFEGSKDAVFIANKDLSIIEMNEAASFLFGLDKKNTADTNLFDFIKNEEQKEQVDQLLKTANKFNDLEIQIRNQKQEIKFCLLSCSFQKNSDQEELIHGILHDITNIKKAELANLQAQKLAANERLMRILAHEIRNPLNNISLSAEQLFEPDKVNEEKQKHIMEIIQRNCLRINKIITELLNLTKPAELVLQKHSLQEIVDESIHLTSDRINLQNIKVKKEYPQTPLEIPADKSKLIIAFTNILINAIEAMEMNTGELTVSIRELPETYSVSIKDNGHGISEEYISKLFEPFFTSKKNGTGLGLAASQSIIQLHKGNIQIESALNKGSNFTVSFLKNSYNS